MSESGDHLMVGMSEAAVAMLSGSVDVASNHCTADSVPGSLAGFGLSSRCMNLDIDALIPPMRERKLTSSVCESVLLFLIKMLPAHMMRRNALVVRRIEEAVVW